MINTETGQKWKEIKLIGWINTLPPFKNSLGYTERDIHDKKPNPMTKDEFRKDLEEQGLI